MYTDSRQVCEAILKILRNCAKIRLINTLIVNSIQLFDPSMIFCQFNSLFDQYGKLLPNVS
jgi:hypothetical protein